MAGLLVRTSTARSADDGNLHPPRRWIAIRLHGAGWTPAFAASVLTDIAAEVSRHGVDVARADEPRSLAPMAILDLEASQASAVRMTLELADGSAAKSATRELQLDSVPADGHSLAVAVAADELLISSWIKLASPPAVETADGAQAGGEEAAGTLAGAAAAAPSLRSAPRWELGLLAASDGSAARAWSAGLDLTLRRWLSPRWGIELSAGGRRDVETSAPHGEVRSRALPLALALVAGAVPAQRRWRAGAAAAFVASPLFYSAQPTAGAIATSETALALSLRGDLWADVAWKRVRLRVALGAGIPVRSVTADDAGAGVSGMRGLALQGQLGLVLEL